MNKQAASELIDDELNRRRLMPWSQLVSAIGVPETFNRVGADGLIYQLEVEVFWDHRKAQDVRVIVAADDGGLRAFKPLTGDFIMRPDGSFADES